jgi:uncharacterized protein YegP (UPF0339 family)
MPATFILRRSTDGQYYFVLTAENNEPVLTSEMYKARTHALQGIRAVRTNAARPKAFSRLLSTSGQPYFVLRAANLEPIGTSEMYTSAPAMENGIAAVRRVAPTAPERDETT